MEANKRNEWSQQTNEDISHLTKPQNVLNKDTSSQDQPINKPWFSQKRRKRNLGELNIWLKTTLLEASNEGEKWTNFKMGICWWEEEWTKENQTTKGAALRRTGCSGRDSSKGVTPLHGIELFTRNPSHISSSFEAKNYVFMYRI